MTTDEAVAVAREESARLRYKAANLRNRQMVVMAAQEERIADMIEVVLAERERLRDQVENLLHRMTSEEAAQEIERLREEQKTLRWLGEHWPAFWIVMPGWAQAEKYRAAMAALAGKARS